jgi:hypothetical protein
MDIYQKRKMFIVGKDDNKIHKILDKRSNMTFAKIGISIRDISINIPSEIIKLNLISHSIYPNNIKDHIVLRFSRGYIELSIGDTIIVDNSDFYIIRTNIDKTIISTKFKSLGRRIGLISYSTTYLNSPLDL